VAHTCNPSYSGGGDQKDHSSKLVRANSLQDPIWKKPITKGLLERLKVQALISNPSTKKKKKKKKQIKNIKVPGSQSGQLTKH
jgi:hypothetical protein